MSNVYELDAAPAVIAEFLGITQQMVMEKLTVDLHGKIVLRTPVDTGRARNSWNISEGTPDTTVPPEATGKAKVASAASRRAAAKKIKVTGAGAGGAASISGKKEVFITSSLDYIEFLEDGTSQQAPAGMVKVSMAEIEAELEILIEGLIRGA